MACILTYEEFMKQSYEECKNEDWFPAVLEDCSTLETDDLTMSALIGEIHEGLRENLDEGVKFFWTIFLINPLIAVKAYQETELLLRGGLDLYGTFKHVSPIYPYSRTDCIYNLSIENFLIFVMEALLQKDMNPEMLDAVNQNYLIGLYEHDRAIMTNKSKYHKAGMELPKKWINHRNLNHILNATDPRHIIILLHFFADKYGARLHKGNVGKYCYSGDKYDYIIRFIKEKYGSLSEYIEWDNNNYNYFYRNYYEKSLCYDEMFANIDVIFPTQEDKDRIQQMSGISISDTGYLDKRNANRRKNPHHKTDTRGNSNQ